MRTFESGLRDGTLRERGGTGFDGFDFYVNIVLLPLMHDVRALCGAR